MPTLVNTIGPRNFHVVMAVSAALAASAAALHQARGAAPGPHYVTVRQITMEQGFRGRFEPSVVRAHRGDVLRFVTDGIAIHNVSFAPSNVPGASMPGMMPYLTRPGQVNDVPVDLPPGKYHFQCNPHEAVGEVGTLVVEE